MVPWRHRPARQVAAVHGARLTAVDAATLAVTSIRPAVPSVHVPLLSGLRPVTPPLAPSRPWLAVEELDDVVGELHRVLVEEAVIRIEVDSELGVREVLGE